MTDKRTGAAPKVVDGVTFHCYRTGILTTEWRSEDGRLGASLYSQYHATYVARVGEKYLEWFFGKRFRSLENALRAAVKAGKIARKIS
jgi:hypothetical protein